MEPVTRTLPLAPSDVGAAADAREPAPLLALRADDRRRRRRLPVLRQAPGTARQPRTGVAAQRAAQPRRLPAGNRLHLWLRWPRGQAATSRLPRVFRLVQWPLPPPQSQMPRGRARTALAGFTAVLAVADRRRARSAPRSPSARTQLGKTRDGEAACPSCSETATERLPDHGAGDRIPARGRRQGATSSRPERRQDRRLERRPREASKEERDIFGEAAMTDEFGKSPTAGIAILRKKEEPPFKLLRQSPILKVQQLLRREPDLHARQAARINKGNIVALTTATWLPSFAFKGQPQDTPGSRAAAGRTARSPTACPPMSGSITSSPTPGRTGRSGASASTSAPTTNARLLYWAYLAPRD